MMDHNDEKNKILFQFDTLHYTQCPCPEDKTSPSNHAPTTTTTKDPVLRCLSLTIKGRK